MSCPLCEKPQEALYASLHFYVIDAKDPDYPGYVRIVSTQHKKEMTDLSEEASEAILKALLLTEKVMRDVMRPDKVNLAEFGNMVPHLHWHIIPRYQNDAHFPNSTWGERQRTVSAEILEARRLQTDTFFSALKKALKSTFG